MHWSHLFQIDEALPVKNFWSLGHYGWDNLFPCSYKHPLSVHLSGNRTLRTEVSLKLPLQSVRVKRKGGIAYLKMESQSFVPKCDLDPQPRVMALELLKYFKNFWIYFLMFFSRSPPYPMFNYRGIDFLKFYLLATSKFGKKERGCNFACSCPRLQFYTMSS